MLSRSTFPVLTLSITALAASLCCAEAPAQEQAKVAQQLERVEVTGSNIKRTSREGSSPIDVITARDIRATGAKTTMELLKLMPAVGNNGFSDAANQNSFSRGVATASLRNLSSTSTLILLNGRRMTPSAYANPNNGTSTLYDLNSIPVSAIERIELLKDGASAVYGSDAIGGVINFITRSDYQGFEVRATAGANEHNEYQQQGLSGTAGFGDLETQGYNLIVGVNLGLRGRSMEGDSTDDGIYAADYRAINLRRNPFSSVGGNGSAITWDSPLLTREGSPGLRNFSQTTAANVVNVLNCPSSQQITGGSYYGITTQPLLNRTFCNKSLDPYNEMQNPGSDASLMSRGTVRIRDTLTGFAELAYSRSERKYLAPPRTINGLNPTSNFLLGGAAPTFQPILEIGHPDNPFSDARAAVQLRFENLVGGNDTTNQGYRALAGVKGTLWSNWDWESAVLWNRSDRDETIYGFPRVPVLQQMLGAPGPDSGRSLASIAADPDLSHPLFNKGSASIAQWDGKVTTDFGKLPGGPIGFAAGLEFRHESIDIRPDPDNAAGNILGLSNTAVRGSRNVTSAFAELSTPFFKSFTMDFAGRLDKYPGIKTNFVPKIGAKWEVNPVLALRGTYSEGFRAPAVSQVSPGGAQFFVQSLKDPVRCDIEKVPPVPLPGAENADCSKTVSGIGGANPALRPETAYSSSFGLILSPVKNVDLLLGWFKIRKNGEVALGDAQSAIDHPNLYPPGSVIRDTNPTQLLNGVPGTGPLLAVSTPWTNQGSTMVSGVDFEFKTSTSVMGSAKWSNSLNGTYTSRYERLEQAGFAPNNLAGTRGGIADWATSAPDIPRTKLRFSTLLENDAHTFTGAMNYVSGISFIRRMDGHIDPAGGYPAYYSGTTCQYGGPNDIDKVPGRSIQGDVPTPTNGRDLYINRYPGCSMSRWMTFDVGYSYSGFKNLVLAINVQNFTDEKAPYDPAAGYLGYNSGLHNPYGRYYTLSASYSFH
ncbi:MAG TPA: TonB-dependent receptor [Burkholderiaceae bacterium]|jgi:iron complex outermembrane receptor protein